MIHSRLRVREGRDARLLPIAYLSHVATPAPTRHCVGEAEAQCISPMPINDRRISRAAKRELSSGRFPAGGWLVAANGATTNQGL